MTKLSKKTFKPNLMLEVVDSQTKIAGMTRNEFEVWGSNDACYPNETFTLPVGTIITTVRLRVVGGSARAQFKVAGTNRLLNAFWLDFKNFTHLIEFD